jgi:hypothetical protein
MVNISDQKKCAYCGNDENLSKTVEYYDFKMVEVYICKSCKITKLEECL